MALSELPRMPYGMSTAPTLGALENQDLAELVVWNQGLSASNLEEEQGHLTQVHQSFYLVSASLTCREGD